MDLMKRRGMMLSAPHLERAFGPIASFKTNYPHKLERMFANIEPVQDGSGDPSPENVRPITGWTGAKVTRAGKNLIKVSADNYYDGQRSTVEYTDSGLAVTATGTYGRVSHVVNGLIVGEAYTISFNGISTGDINNVYIFWNSPWSDDSRYGTLSLTATVNNKNLTFVARDSALYVGFYVTGSGTSGVMTISELQLELGSTPTAYEPYQGDTYNITFPSEAGTVYGGTLDVTSGVLTVDRQLRNANTLTWFYDSVSGVKTFNCVYAPSKEAEKRQIWCSHFKPVVSQYFAPSPDVTITNVWARYYNINIRYDALTSLEEWNTFINNNDVMIGWYLANPVTYQLTPQEIVTLLGQNNIWADTGDVDVTYYKT